MASNRISKDMTPREGRKAAVQTPTAAWIARGADEAALLEAAKKDARVCLAGSTAQRRFQKAHGQRTDNSGWEEDRKIFTSTLLVITYLHNGGTCPLPDSFAPTDQHRASFRPLEEELKTETLAMVIDNWPSIKKVARAFKRGGIFNQSDVDALLY